MEAYVTALLERSEAAAAAMSREAAAPEGDSGTVSAVRQARQAASELFRQMPQASEPEEAAPSPAAVWDSREAARARYGGVREEFAGSGARQQSSMEEISRFFERDARRYG